MKVINELLLQLNIHVDSQDALAEDYNLFRHCRQRVEE